MENRMTLQDVMVDMRSRGLRMNMASISTGIKCGAFPFGKVLNVGGTGRATFLILRSDYERWADENLR